MFRSSLSDRLKPGNVFDQLTLQQRVDIHYWWCLCTCGNRTRVYAYNLIHRKSRSCGCTHIEIARQMNYRHGKTHTSEFRIWVDMRKRCTNPKSKSYPNYGGRGISVCERWQIFENFLADMGQRPTPLHTIERKNNNGNYEPDNCKWATRAEQVYNKRNNIIFEHQGRIWTTKDVSLHTGLRISAIRKRVRLGWPPERILSEPKRAW